MNVYLRIDNNVMAMVLLSTVYIIGYMRLDRQDILNRKFLNTSFFILIELFIETTTCIINRRPEHWLIPITIFMHIGLFILSPILSYLLYDFVRCWVNPNNTEKVINRVLVCIPIYINTVIVLISPIYRFIFYIDSSNIYHRGQLFFISALITYCYIIYSFVFLLKQRNNLLNQERRALFLFGLIPAIGGYIQTLYYGALLMWSCAAYCLIIVYIFLQLRMVHVDSLTGAWTRYSFEQYIAQRIKQKKGFGAIYIDLDGFKSINDEYGHQEGDLAIKTTVHLIKSLLKKSDIIARLGGDEFILISEDETSQKLEDKINKIESKLNQYNKKSGKTYELKCSFGADIYNPAYGNLEQFLYHVDKLMYKNKRSKKNIV